jgi:energy-coupling factor transporter ATP-binding protein EcfA2
MTKVLLEARTLGRRFPDGCWAVRAIDFAIARGEIVVLAGRNGAGKTVLAKHLAGLAEPTEGIVLFEGRRFSEYSAPPAARVGYVFQDARLQLIGDTVEDDVLFGPANLGIAPREAQERADRAIERCGLGERKRAFVHTLSGGEIRRLALAGMIAMGPSVVILDEPFANLDRDGVSSVLRVVADLAAEGIAILVVTHELEKVLGMSHRLDVMDGGRIVLSGEPGPTLAEGIERFGLRDPLRKTTKVEELSWLE